MIDLLFLTDLSLKLLLLISFIVMIIIYYYQSKSNKVENNFFLFCIIFGTLAMIPFIIDTITYQLYHNGMLRVNLETITFTLFGVYFYFFYRHYQSITDTMPYIWINIITACLVILESILAILFFIGILPPNLHEIGLNIPRDQLIVTYVSFITFIIGVLSSGFALYTIMHNNLIEIHKSTIFELISILILFCDNIFLIINDILVTYNFYDLVWSYIIVTGAIFIYIIGLVLFIVNNILFLPPHIYSPSLLYNKFKELGPIFSSNTSIEKMTSLEQLFGKNNTSGTPNNTTTRLNYTSLINEPGIKALNNKFETIISNEEEKYTKGKTLFFRQENLITSKLTTTSIEILIYLLKSVHDIIYANKIEKDLKLKKNTVSYNLGLLESNFLIDPRKVDIENDTRYKQVKINQHGIEYLNNFYNMLKEYFE